MNKKIKTLVQKYEKDMQFENRFDELKDKLDLIPDQNLNTDIIVIRKKLVPAYTMMIVLLMLVTGIIGLQFGLNSNYISGPEELDIIEKNLSDHMDIYQREAITSYVIDDQLYLSLYIGYQDNKKKIVIVLFSKTQSIVLDGTIDGNPLQMSSNRFVYTVNIDEDIVELDINAIFNESLMGSINSTLDLSSYYEWLQE